MRSTDQRWKRCSASHHCGYRSARGTDLSLLLNARQEYLEGKVSQTAPMSYIKQRVWGSGVPPIACIVGCTPPQPTIIAKPPQAPPRRFLHFQTHSAEIVCCALPQPELTNAMTPPLRRGFAFEPKAQGFQRERPARRSLLLSIRSAASPGTGSGTFRAVTPDHSSI